MVKKMAKKILYLYFVISFLLMAVCFFIGVSDCVNKLCHDEFILLPVLNMAQFKSNGTLEEQYQMLEKASEFDQELYMSGHGTDDPLCSFINISLAIALCNFPLYYLLRLFNVQLPRCIFKMILSEIGLAFVLIAAMRIYVRNSFGSAEVKIRFPAAYVTWRDIFLPVFVLAILTGIKKMLRED